MAECRWPPETIHTEPRSGHRTGRPVLCHLRGAKLQREEPSAGAEGCAAWWCLVVEKVG